MAWPDTDLADPWAALEDDTIDAGDMFANITANFNALRTLITLLKKLPLGAVGNALGPAGLTDVNTATTTVEALTVTVSDQRKYGIFAAVQGQKITNAGNGGAVLLETTSGFSPTLIATAAMASGDISSGFYSGIWTPGSGQTSAVWHINVTSANASYRVNINCASILVLDVGGI